MTVDTSPTPPALTHAQAQAGYVARATQLQRQDAIVSWLRVLAFAAAVFAGWLAYGALRVPPALFGAAVAGFALLVLAHARVARALARAHRAADWHRRQMEAAQDQWPTQPGGGAGVMEAHPYAQDLDLFGPLGLFVRLCQARTRAGMDVLTQWLCQPSDVTTALERQEAVRELEGRLDAREALALAGTTGTAEVDTAALLAWVRAQGPAFQATLLHAVALVPGVAGVAALAAWIWADVGPGPTLAMMAINAVLGRQLGHAVHGARQAAEQPARELGRVAAVAAVLERWDMQAPLVRRLVAALGQGTGETASQAVGGLAQRLAWADLPRNQLMWPFTTLVLWEVHAALAVERWRRKHAPQLAGWLDAMGSLETLAGLAAYAHANPAHTVPVLVAAQPEVVLECTALGHPLLPRQRCVGNNVNIVPPVRLLLVSGSNMSGKSTLLRAVGMNMVLGMCGAPVRAAAMRFSPASLACTMRVEDSLQAGRSRFMAELQRLRVVQDLASAGPTVFLLDEILHGTNSQDRLAGGQAVLRALVGHKAIGLCTTHDLALARAVDVLGNAAVNMHFADDMADGQMHFDHVMRPGVVERGNALALMRVAGLEV